MKEVKVITKKNDAIKSVGGAVVITNKLLINVHEALFEWWNGLEEIWQFLFLKQIEYAFDKIFSNDDNEDYCYDIDESGIEFLSGYDSNYNFIQALRNKLREPTINELIYLINLNEIRICDWGIYHHNLTSLKPLEKLKKLKKLKILKLDKVDMNHLSNLNELTELVLYKTKVINLKSISTHTNLEILTLYDCSIEEVTPLASLHKLIKLNLNYNKITDISPLSALTNLWALHLYNNIVIDGEPIKYLTKLNCLNLVSNKLTDIENFIYYFNPIRLNNFYFDDVIYQKKYNDYNINVIFGMKMNGELSKGITLINI
jgi:hypothetical protein